MREPRTGRGARRDPVGPEDAPVVALEVPGDEVPAPALRDEMVRFGAPRQPGGVARVVEPQHHPLAHGIADREQHGRVDGCGWRSPGRREREPVDAVAQPRRHHLPDRGERAFGGLFHVGAGTRHGLQGDRDRHRLVVVEQQRRQLGSGVEAVAAIRALDRADAVAELPESVDVAAHGSGAHREPSGERRIPASRVVPAAARAAAASARWGRPCRQPRSSSGHDLAATAVTVSFAPGIPAHHLDKETPCPSTSHPTSTSVATPARRSSSTRPSSAGRVPTWRV